MQAKGAKRTKRAPPPPPPPRYNDPALKGVGTIHASATSARAIKAGWTASASIVNISVGLEGSVLADLCFKHSMGRHNLATLPLVQQRGRTSHKSPAVYSPVAAEHSDDESYHAHEEGSWQDDAAVATGADSAGGSEGDAEAVRLRCPYVWQLRHRPMLPLLQALRQCEQPAVVQ